MQNLPEVFLKSADFNKYNIKVQLNLWRLYMIWISEVQTDWQLSAALTQISFRYQGSVLVSGAPGSRLSWTPDIFRALYGIVCHVECLNRFDNEQCANLQRDLLAPIISLAVVSVSLMISAECLKFQTVLIPLIPLW